MESTIASRYSYPDFEEQPSYVWLGRAGQAGPAGDATADQLPEEMSEESESEPQDDDGDDMEMDDDAGKDPDHAAISLDPVLQDDRMVDDSETSSDEGSYQDNEFFTLQSDVVRFQKKLLVARRGRLWRPVDEPGWRKGGKRGPKGPRKPVEPSLEIKLLLSQANEAFIARDYDRTEELATRVINMNAETYAAHALLSAVFLEQGQVQMGVVAQMSAAHLRPREASVWQTCVKLILEKGRAYSGRYLNDAVYCYTRILGINPKDFEARYQRALLLRELKHKGRAAREFEQMLDMIPEDTTILRQLAETYIDLGEVGKARERYQTHIERAMEAGGLPGDGFSWSDLNIYVELFDYDAEYLEGIKELKALSRWLLGREGESYWNEIDDDREWDADDAPRRLSVAGFRSNRFGRHTYGEGLPLELRIKLGIYRLKGSIGELGEAFAHFHWLGPETTGPAGKVHDYPDLFQASADVMMEKGLYAQAVSFYEPLHQVDGFLSHTVYTRMATCYQKLEKYDEAERMYQLIIEDDEGNIDARVQLAKLFESQGMLEQAFVYVNEVLALERKSSKVRELKRTRTQLKTAISHNAEPSMPAVEQAADETSRPKPRRKSLHVDRASAQKEQEELIQMLFVRAQELEVDVRAGNAEAIEEWAEAVETVTDDFRAAKVFYPQNRYIRFMGYRKGRSSAADGAVGAVDEMAERLQASLEQAGATETGPAEEIPTSYRGIAFSEWLAMFLKYALFFAREGETGEAYDMISAAHDANVFHHSNESMFLIHMCWAACALAAHDDEAICTASRWVTKEFQFTTDAYRLHAALNRLCHGPNTWYNSSPSQKYILRQIKAMDFSLVGDDDRTRFFIEKASYSAKDDEGNFFINDDMDVVLLLLYGEMLYSGTSYTYALNYFFRAHSLDPDHPVIKFYIGLGYIQWALKRQVENRHYFIVQGMTFLYEYHELRQQSPNPVEKQEADYNLARTLHMLGLTHLAVPSYERVLEISLASAQQSCSNSDGSDDPSIAKPSSITQDFAREAAYNLQSIYFMSGNMAMVKTVTERYLVV